MIWNGKNRVAEELAKMASELKEQRAKNLASNLKWEIDQKDWSVEALWGHLHANDKAIILDTVERWSKGKTGNLLKAHRKLLAKVLGYSDPDSILEDDHIQRRSVQIAPKRHRAPAPDMNSSMSQILVAVDQSAESTIEQTSTVIDEVLSSPYAPYLKIAAYLLKAKLVFSEIDKQSEQHRYQPS